MYSPERAYNDSHRFQMSISAAVSYRTGVKQAEERSGLRARDMVYMFTALRLR